MKLYDFKARLLSKVATVVTTGPTSHYFQWATTPQALVDPIQLIIDDMLYGRSASQLYIDCYVILHVAEGGARAPLAPHLNPYLYNFSSVKICILISLCYITQLMCTSSIYNYENTIFPIQSQLQYVQCMQGLSVKCFIRRRKSTVGW